MDTNTLLIILGFWVICGIGAYLITAQKGRADAGSAGIMGFILGPLGLVIAATAKTPSPDTIGRVCVHCGKIVDPDRERLCNHCGEPFAT